MRAHPSALEDLALHGVRVLGFPTPGRIAGRWRLDRAAVEEALLDAEARGWAQQTSFGGSSGWSLTDAGRAEGERRLASELDLVGARPAVQDVHARFRPLNRRFGAACTDWQIRPDRLDPMAANDHTDWRWDERVLRTLSSVERSFVALCAELADRLERFDGYGQRYSAALRRVQAGERRWVDAPEQDSLHLLWIQFHEDLLASLGIERGTDG
ncbi:transcriptional regulator [Blastococcus sp. TBT05-19]|uniref:transcriptional regulator n=1 Tax=Blastococcus sp. TBT05-19 TaxID=2250581 RepID=UPI000DEA6840|nr:transcriptional regulator [Blastococcus sp. TBT05-19]RBY89082.1 transcriptional regulator [Blastococcus sp. TBT05-19]